MGVYLELSQGEEKIPLEGPILSQLIHDSFCSRSYMILQRQVFTNSRQDI